MTVVGHNSKTIYHLQNSGSCSKACIVEEPSQLGFGYMAAKEMVTKARIVSNKHKHNIEKSSLSTFLFRLFKRKKTIPMSHSFTTKIIENRNFVVPFFY